MGGSDSSTRVRQSATSNAPKSGSHARRIAPAVACNHQFHHSELDPLRKHGPGSETHPEEWAESLRRAAELGVEVRFRSNGSMAYAPAPMPGSPGQLLIDPDASWGAMLHEMTHIMDDHAMGWGGYRQMWDPAHTFDREKRAYLKEIDYAKSIGDYESVKVLYKILEQERVRILEPKKDDPS